MIGRSGNEARNAIVVGGGIIGIASALNLQSRGIRTTLVDPERLPRPASWGNAGHIAIEQVAPLASRATLMSFPGRLFSRGGALALPLGDIATWLPFAIRFGGASRPDRFRAGKAALGAALGRAVPAWRRLLSRAGAEALLEETGHFVVWESPATAAEGRKAWAKADIGTATFRDATEDEMSLLHAHLLARPAGAIRFSGSAQIADLGQMAEALSAQFAGTGGTRLRACARLVRENGKAVAFIDDRRLKADLVVVAGGVASAKLLAPFGYRVPIIAERGYHLQTERADWPAELPPVVFEDRSMIVTRFRTGVRAAGFVEFGRAESPPDPRKWKRLRCHLAALGISFGVPITEWMGARPTLPDYLPAIGRSRRADNLLYAFGHQHLGLTLAAITGEAIGALAGGEEPPLDLSPFDLERF